MIVPARQAMVGKPSPRRPNSAKGDCVRCTCGRELLLTAFSTKKRTCRRCRVVVKSSYTHSCVHCDYDLCARCFVAERRLSLSTSTALPQEATICSVQSGTDDYSVFTSAEPALEGAYSAVVQVIHEELQETRAQLASHIVEHEHQRKECSASLALAAGLRGRLAEQDGELAAHKAEHAELAQVVAELRGSAVRQNEELGTRAARELELRKAVATLQDGAAAQDQELAAQSEREAALLEAVAGLRNNLAWCEEESAAHEAHGMKWREASERLDSDVACRNRELAAQGSHAMELLEACRKMREECAKQEADITVYRTKCSAQDGSIEHLQSSIVGATRELMAHEVCKTELHVRQEAAEQMREVIAAQALELARNTATRTEHDAACIALQRVQMELAEKAEMCAMWENSATEHRAHSEEIHHRASADQSRNAAEITALHSEASIAECRSLDEALQWKDAHQASAAGQEEALALLGAAHAELAATAEELAAQKAAACTARSDHAAAIAGEEATQVSLSASRMELAAHGQAVAAHEAAASAAMDGLRAAAAGEEAALVQLTAARAELVAGKEDIGVHEAAASTAAEGHRASTAGEEAAAAQLAAVRAELAAGREELEAQEAARLTLEAARLTLEASRDEHAAAHQAHLALHSEVVEQHAHELRAREAELDDRTKHISVIEARSEARGQSADAANWVLEAHLAGRSEQLAARTEQLAAAEALSALHHSSASVEQAALEAARADHAARTEELSAAALEALEAERADHAARAEQLSAGAAEALEVERRRWTEHESAASSAAEVSQAQLREAYGLEYRAMSDELQRVNLLLARQAAESAVQYAHDSASRDLIPWQVEDPVAWESPKAPPPPPLKSGVSGAWEASTKAPSTPPLYDELPIAWGVSSKDRSVELPVPDAEGMSHGEPDSDDSDDDIPPALLFAYMFGAAQFDPGQNRCDSVPDVFFCRAKRQRRQRTPVVPMKSRDLGPAQRRGGAARDPSTKFLQVTPSRAKGSDDAPAFGSRANRDVDVTDFKDFKRRYVSDIEAYGEEDLRRQHLPIFIVAQSLVTLTLWTVAAMVEAATMADWMTVVAGLDTIFPGETAVVAHRDCEDHRQQVYRWWTYQFSHAGFTHIGMNVCMNLLFGVALEGFHGTAWVFLMYNLGVLGGGLCQLVADSHAGGLVGMSAGCYALAGVHLADLRANWSQHRFPARKLLVFALLLAVDALNVYLVGRGLRQDSAPVTTIAYCPQVGGAITGFLAATVLGRGTIKDFRVGTVLGRGGTLERHERVIRLVAFAVGLVLIVFCTAWVSNWPPRTLWDPTPWCWARRISNASILGDAALHCVRCGDQACADRWSAAVQCFDNGCGIQGANCSSTACPVSEAFCSERGWRAI